MLCTHHTQSVASLRKIDNISLDAVNQKQNYRFSMESSESGKTEANFRWKWTELTQNAKLKIINNDLMHATAATVCIKLAICFSINDIPLLRTNRIYSPNNFTGFLLASSRQKAQIKMKWLLQTLQNELITSKRYRNYNFSLPPSTYARFSLLSWMHFQFPYIRSVRWLPFTAQVHALRRFELLDNAWMLAPPLSAAYLTHAARWAQLVLCLFWIRIVCSTR